MSHKTEQQPNLVQWEVDLLGDIDPVVRLSSAVELGRRQAAEAAPALVERLGLEREFFIRQTLTWAVLRIAGDAMAYLHQALSSPRWLARMQAMHVLSKMGRYEAADRLVPLVRDEVDGPGQRPTVNGSARAPRPALSRPAAQRTSTPPGSASATAATAAPARCGIHARNGRSEARSQSPSSGRPWRSSVPGWWPGRCGPLIDSGCGRPLRHMRACVQPWRPP
jgi:hypothetical protein